MAARPDMDARTRGILATVIIVIGIGGIITVSLVSIFTLGDDDRAEMTRLVFSSVLPLLGTWIGTVLAFYFARESLQAATDSTSQLIGHADLESPVSDVMIPRNRITSHMLAPGADADSVSLETLMAEMQGAGVHRIPILSAIGAAIHVVHEATITKFIAIPPVPVGGGTPPGAPLAGKTVADLRAVPDLAALISAVGYVPASARVKDARATMRRIPSCNDVFVTARGRADEPVDGWLTNSDLASLT